MMRHYAPPTRDINPFLFFILAGPVLLYLLNSWIVPSIGVPVLDVPVDKLLKPGVDYAEAIGRNRFLGAFLFFTTVVVISLVAFWAELRNALSGDARKFALLAFFLAQVPVALSVYSHKDRSLDTWRTYHQLGEGVLEQTLSTASIGLCTGGTAGAALNQPDATLFPGAGLIPKTPCTDNPAFELFRVMLDIVTILSGLGVSALVLGMILSLARPVKVTDLDLRAFEHGKSQRAARRFLYLAGLMLSTGMFLTMSWMHWPMPMVDTKAFPAYADVVSSLLFYNGVFFTLLIVTGFGPVMFLNTRYSDRLAMENLLSSVAAVPETDDAPDAPEPAPPTPPVPPTVKMLDDWKAKHGLRISLTEAIQALIATCSPLLTAFAGSFAPI